MIDRKRMIECEIKLSKNSRVTIDFEGLKVYITNKERDEHTIGVYLQQVHLS